MLIMMLSWAAMACAISGRAFTALKSSRMRFWGFVAYVIGSILWIMYGIPNHQTALVIQNLVLIFFSFVGLKNNWKSKKSDT